MNAPDELKYTETHEWVRLEGNEATVGITDFAQNQLTTLTFVELPAVGDPFSAGDEIVVVESVKQAADVYAVGDGTVSAVNEALENDPEAVNKDPYGEGWLYRITLSDPGQLDSLMDAAAYRALAPDES